MLVSNVSWSMLPPKTSFFESHLGQVPDAPASGRPCLQYTGSEYWTSVIFESTSKKVPSVHSDWNRICVIFRMLRNERVMILILVHVEFFRCTNQLISTSQELECLAYLEFKSLQKRTITRFGTWWPQAQAWGIICKVNMLVYNTKTDHQNRSFFQFWSGKIQNGS